MLHVARMILCKCAHDITLSCYCAATPPANLSLSLTLISHQPQWWEIDLGYYFICLLGALGLAWDIKTPTEADKARKRKPVVAADNSEAVLVDATGKLE